MYRLSDTLCGGRDGGRVDDIFCESLKVVNVRLNSMCELRLSNSGRHRGAVYSHSTHAILNFAERDDLNERISWLHPLDHRNLV